MNGTKKRKGNLKSGMAEMLLFFERHPDKIFKISELGLSAWKSDRFRTFFLKKEKGAGNYSFCKEKILARGYANCTDMILAEGCIPYDLLRHHIYKIPRQSAFADMVRKIKSFTMMKMPEKLI